MNVDSFTLDELKTELVNSIEKKKSTILYGFSLSAISLMNKYPEIYKYGNEADIMVADGHLFYKFCKTKMKIPLSLEISIPQSVCLLLNIANNYNLKVFLLGANKETNATAQLMIRNNFSNIKECGGHHGYFDSSEHETIIETINKFNPDILLIGISSPTKEVLAHKWKNKLNTGVIIPCGGMIDVLAEKTKLTPPLIKRLGLASLYRIMQEPKRLLKHFAYIYYFFFFRLLPVLFWQTVILRRKNFSIPDYFNIK